MVYCFVINNDCELTVRSISELVQAIRGRGGKVTPQRMMIWQLLEGDTSHPTAEAVYARVRATLPTVSLTTVYKTLNELVAIGELRRFDLHGKSHFDPNTEEHAEIVCLGCDRVLDLPHTAPAALPQVADFTVVGQAQTFYGYCARCQEARLLHDERANRQRETGTGGMRG